MVVPVQTNVPALNVMFLTDVPLEIKDDPEVYVFPLRSRVPAVRFVVLVDPCVNAS